MKQLQNNFTTPEQSKRLLELGVPADSADCYWNDICLKPIPMQEGILYSDKRNQFTKVNVPCWSVGRLIEIIGICHQPIPTEMRIATSNIIEYLLDIFDTITDGSGFDFSKLDNDIKN